MGEIIRKSASVEEIMADARHALVGATTKGGVWKAAADQSLTPAVTLFDTVETKRVVLENTVVPLVAALNHQDEVADAAIGRMSDSVWNDVGRPAPGADPSYELLFPSGISFYTDGPDDEQPERMELLVDLLESGIHPRLPAAQAKAYATEIRNQAKALSTAVEALRLPRIRLAMYGRMRTTAAKNTQAALSRFKRLLKVGGLSETEIHTVIPDRPVQAKKSAALAALETAPEASKTV